MKQHDNTVGAMRASMFVQIAFIFWCTMGSPEARAQVIRTSDGVYQTFHTKVVTAQGRNKDDKMGIWITVGPAVDPQLFDPSALKKDDVLHAFIEYNPSSDRYTAVHVGERQYRVKGNFTMLVPSPYEQVRIGVDNNNPLITVVIDTKRPPSQSFLLAFRGLKHVANESGPQKVALLEANQLNPEYQGIIEPYVLTSAGLDLKGAPLPEETALGVELETPKNPCLRPGAVFVPSAEVLRIRSLKREESIQELEKLMARTPTADPLQGVLLLSVDAGRIIGLDYTSGVIKMINTVGKARPQICAVKEIPLGE